MSGNSLWRLSRLFRSLPALGLLALAAALLVAGCSDDGGSGDNGSDTGASSSTTAQPTAETTAPAGETAASAGSIEVTDASGETLSLDGPATRIVSHSPAATEILFAIGAGDRVVAVDEFSYYPPEAEALPKVSYSTPDAELALSFDPDLIIFSGQQEASLDHFRELGLEVFFLTEPGDLDGVFEHIRTLGELTGEQEGAEAIVEDMQTRIDAVAAAVEDVEEGPLVFYEVTEELYTASPDSFVGAALTLLKARNVAEGVEGDYPQLSSEAVVDANPDVILMADAAFIPIESVPERAGWSGITAVVEGRIYPVDGDIMSRPGPRLVEGIEEIARLLYPDRFE